MSIQQFPLLPLFLLLCCLVVIALISIILNSLPKQTASVSGGLYVICGIILTLSIIGFALSLQKTIEAFIIKSADVVQDANHAEVRRVMMIPQTKREMQLFVANLLGYIAFGCTVVALTSVIISFENSVSPSSYVFACIILGFSIFTLALLLIFFIVRCIEYYRLPPNESTNATSF